MIELMGLSHVCLFPLESIRGRFCLPNRRELEGKRIVALSYLAWRPLVACPNSKRHLVCEMQLAACFLRRQEWTKRLKGRRFGQKTFYCEVF